MEDLQEHFNFLKSLKKDEYNLKEKDITFSNGKLSEINLTTGSVIIDKFAPSFKIEKNELNQWSWIVPKDAINYLYPDNLDSREFWKKSVEIFPYSSITGTHKEIKSVNDANEFSFKCHLATKPLLWFLDNVSEGCKILEIGPGYGAVYYKVIQSLNEINVDYYSIDVNPLFEHNNMYQCDGRNIPKEIPAELDIVYSINVFQHLSKSQRNSYYTQVFDRLKSGGKFIVGTFCVTPSNVDKPLWGHMDEEGNKYAFFLGQYTEIEYLEEWKKTLKDVGFEIINHSEYSNYVNFELKKP